MTDEIVSESTSLLSKEGNGVDGISKMDFLSKKHYESGNFIDAIRQLEQSLALREQRFGINSLETLVNLNNLGSALARYGKLSEAEKIFTQVLDIREMKLVG